MFSQISCSGWSHIHKLPLDKTVWLSNDFEKKKNNGDGLLLV